MITILIVGELKTKLCFLLGWGRREPFFTKKKDWKSLSLFLSKKKKEKKESKKKNK